MKFTIMEKMEQTGQKERMKINAKLNTDQDLK